MTAGVDLERRLADWFIDEAPGRAPDRVLTWRWNGSRPSRSVEASVDTSAGGGTG